MFSISIEVKVEASDNKVASCFDIVASVDRS